MPTFRLRPQAVPRPPPLPHALLRRFFGTNLPAVTGIRPPADSSKEENAGGLQKISPLRIAVCGSGVVGPTLAGVLSRRLARLQQAYQLSVFERTPAESDQGYGLDLDDYGQQALVQAGVYHRFWTDIARPGSDTCALFSLEGDRMARFSKRKTVIRPECSRGALRKVLLEAAETSSVGQGRSFAAEFDTKVEAVVRRRNGDGFELLGSRKTGQVEVEAERREGSVGGMEQTSLGQFDLVVDCMGWNSTLRQHRVVSQRGVPVGGDTQHPKTPSIELCFDGTIMVHGMMSDPCENPRLSSIFGADGGRGYGTVGVLGGPNRSLFFQQYGAGTEDKRVCMFLFLKTAASSVDAIFRDEIGIRRPLSRRTSLMEGEDLKQVQKWLHQKIDGGGVSWAADAAAAVWHAAVDSLERVTVRPQFAQGGARLELVGESEGEEMPVVCIGDSLANVGIGGGGILGMRDALEVADAICGAVEKGRETRCSSESPAVDPIEARRRLTADVLRAIRALEPEMLKRKEDFRRRKGDSQIFTMPLVRAGSACADVRVWLKKQMQDQWLRWRAGEGDCRAVAGGGDAWVGGKIARAGGDGAAPSIPLVGAAVAGGPGTTATGAPPGAGHNSCIGDSAVPNDQSLKFYGAVASCKVDRDTPQQHCSTATSDNIRPRSLRQRAVDAAVLKLVIPATSRILARTLCAASLVADRFYARALAQSKGLRPGSGLALVSAGGGSEIAEPGADVKRAIREYGCSGWAHRWEEQAERTKTEVLTRACKGFWNKREARGGGEFSCGVKESSAASRTIEDVRVGEGVAAAQQRGSSSLSAQ